MKLALFDFDGTITNKDSFSHFLKFAVGPAKFKQGFVVLLPLIIGYKLRLVSDGKAKELVLTHFFKGWKSETFFSVMTGFGRDQLPGIIKESALERIRWHKEQGHTVVIVSAALECMMKDWCEKEQLDLIGSGLEVKNGVITGKLLGKNCFGIEKVNRVKEKYDVSSYDYIYAYGDSRGDLEMLELANEKYYRHFA